MDFSNIRIAFFDIDGTLIDMQRKQITEQTLETLRALQANGIRICIATGRGPHAVPKFPGVEFDAYLTYNGACCYTPEKQIFSMPIPREQVRRIIRNAAEMGHPSVVASYSCAIANGTEPDLDAYFGIAKVPVPVSERFEAAVSGEVYQLMIAVKQPEYERLLRDAPAAKIAAWWDRAVDVIPAAAGKGVGVAHVLAYFGLDRGQAIAFGDGNNDLEMIEAVGWGVSMGNGSPELKAAAQDVCGPVWDEGIHRYCLEKGLIR